MKRRLFLILPTLVACKTSSAGRIRPRDHFTVGDRYPAHLAARSGK